HLSAVSRKRNTAFTLEELLIVVAVILLLIAVLLPIVFSPIGHSKGRAQRINCINNLKQIGLAYRVWAGDNNDKYPPSVSITNGGTLELGAGTNAFLSFRAMS